MMEGPFCQPKDTGLHHAEPLVVGTDMSVLSWSRADVSDQLESNDVALWVAHESFLGGFAWWDLPPGL